MREERDDFKMEFFFFNQKENRTSRLENSQLIQIVKSEEGCYTKGYGQTTVW